MLVPEAPAPCSRVTGQGGDSSDEVDEIADRYTARKLAQWDEFWTASKLLTCARIVIDRGE
jgi:hypothetical protein